MRKMCVRCQSRPADVTIDSKVGNVTVKEELCVRCANRVRLGEPKITYRDGTKRR